MGYAHTILKRRHNLNHVPRLPTRICPSNIGLALSGERGYIWLYYPDPGKMKRLKIRLIGAIEDSEHLLFADFVQQLSVIREALDGIDGEFFGHGTPTTNYRVVDLSHSSPAAVILEPFPIDKQQNNAAAVVERLLDAVRQINQGTSPDDMDSIMLEKIGKIARPYRRHVSEVVLSSDGEEVRISKTFEANIEKIIGEDLVFDGHLDGTLEMINFHREANKFQIFPLIGASKITCHFPGELLPKAIQSVGKNIRVHGKLKQKQRDRYPYGVDVNEIEILPIETDLPTFADIRGIAPNFTGGISSVEFVQRLRNA